MGDILISNKTAPDTPDTGKTKVYVDSTTKKLTSKDDAGTVTNYEENIDINDLPVDATPDGAADYVMTYDADAGTEKKVLLNDLPSSGGTGDVVGPASSTDNAIPRYDSTTGKLLQNSLVTVSDTGEILTPDGSDSAPAYAFADDTNTGMYSPAADNIAFTLGGTNRFNMSTGAISAFIRIQATAGLWRYSATYTASTTLPATSDVVLVDCTAGDVTLTLPANNYMCVSITKVDNTSNKVILQRAGTDLILGETSYEMDSQYDFIYLHRKPNKLWYPMARERKNEPKAFGQYATIDLPDATQYEGHQVYDTTTQTMKYSNGTTWVAL